MSPHKFHLGESVEFLPQPWDGPVPRGIYTITRVLPGDDFDRTYHARCERDGHMRLVREKQLLPAAAAA
ncbi:hypothetical protein ACE7GA_23665 [Roseomonas sp. CCTCC AB2023176]|uniref:hypothetical protein n=1 Tax=Roseomonas sp. CCTCC AB2023176 TaxID=3342640 RepID=UPI0035DD206A